MIRVFGFLVGICLSLGATEPDYFEVSSEIVNRVQKVFEPKGYVLKGGGGRELKAQKEIALTFAVEQAASIDEARKIFVAIAEEAAAQVNNSHTMLYHFVKYPFDPRNVQLNVTFWPAESHRPSPLVASVNINEGILHYVLSDPQTGKKLGEHTETYQEAYQLSHRR